MFSQQTRGFVITRSCRCDWNNQSRLCCAHVSQWTVRARQWHSVYCTRMWNWSRLVEFSPYSLYYKHLCFCCYGYMSDGLLRWKLLFVCMSNGLIWFEFNCKVFKYNSILFINKCEIAVHSLYSFRREKAAHSLKDSNLLFRLLKLVLAVNSTLHSVNVVWTQ